MLPQGLILYERRDAAPAGFPNALDARTAVKVAEDFLRERGLLTPDVRPDFAVPSPGSPPGHYQVYFTQRHRTLPLLGREWPLFSGYVGVEVSGDTVQAMEAFLLDVEGPAGRRRRVIPADRALRALAAHLDRRGIGEGRLLVDRVELGYWGKTVPGGARWDLAPHWRLLTKDGKSYLVDAFEGRVEESP